MAKDDNFMIQHARETISRAVIGEQPGQYPEAAVMQFHEAIKEFEARTKNDSSCTLEDIQSLRFEGELLLNTVALSDHVVDFTRNTLEYSVYRRELTVLVWLAETALFIEPEYYTEGAKAALRDQIEHAKRVLSGTYTVPFIRNRAFMQPRLDEDIQFAIEYCTMAPSYGMTTYGLKPALEWYGYQDMRVQLAETITVPASCCTYISASSPDQSFSGKAQVEIDSDNIAYLGFQPPSYDGEVLCKARLKLINNHIDSKKLFLHTTNLSSDDIHALTYDRVSEDRYGKSLLGPLLKSFHIGFRDRSAYIDITLYMQDKAGEKGNLVFQLVNEPGAVPCGFYSHTHSDNAKRPLLELKFDRIDASKLDEKLGLVKEQALELTERAVVGAGIGEYPSAPVKEVIRELALLDEVGVIVSPAEAAQSIVRLYDAMRKMRHSRVLRTDMEPGSSLFFAIDGIGKLRHKLEQSPSLQAQYDQLKKLSEAMSLTDIQNLDDLLAEKPDMEKMNARYNLWSESPVLIFTPPAETVTATLAFALPSSEIDEGGSLGHIWIDGVKLSPANAIDIVIDNPGFNEGSDLPSCWIPIARKGKPIMRWENRQQYVREGSHSIYIANPRLGDEGSWEYEKDLQISGGIRHTLTFFAKIDGKLNNGIHAIVTFKDKEGRTIGTYTGIHNKKSMLGSGSVLGSLRFQADAFIYAITGEKGYAEKAKTMMLWSLNDFCQGVESWLRTNLRPDGIDAYGAVQGGRLAVVLATAYSLIRESGVFTQKEFKLLLARVDYLIRDLIDLRDRTELGEYAAQLETGNWHTDMSAGAAMLALAFPELPHARQWFDNGRTILKGQLDYNLNDDGSWPETIRYLYEVIMRYSIFGKALRNVTGENWFHGTKLAKAFEFMVSAQTPPYKYFDNKIGTPNFGDHILGDGYEFAPLGIYTDEVAVESPEWAVRMVQTWKRAGSPFAAFMTERNVLENFFAPIDMEQKEDVPLKLGSQWFSGQGLVTVQTSLWAFGRRICLIDCQSFASRTWAYGSGLVYLLCGRYSASNGSWSRELFRQHF